MPLLPSSSSIMITAILKLPRTTPCGTEVSLIITWNVSLLSNKLSFTIITSNAAPVFPAGIITSP